MLPTVNKLRIMGAWFFASDWKIKQVIGRFKYKLKLWQLQLSHNYEESFKRNCNWKWKFVKMSTFFIVLLRGIRQKVWIVSYSYIER